MKREYGLDICRIIAMIGIIAIHVLGQGGVSTFTISDGIKFYVSQWTCMLLVGAVDLFALLSGYLSINRKHGVSYRVIELISTVLFYCIIITVIFAIVKSSVFTGYKDFLKSFFPFLGGRYWYITCFIPLLILQPFINKMLLSLSEKIHGKLCIILICIFSILPSIFAKDLFYLNYGYSFCWLLICYIIGAYLQRRQFSFKHVKTKSFIIFIVSSIILLLGNLLFYKFFGKFGYMYGYLSPITLIMALCVFYFCKNIKIKGNIVVKYLSIASFDSYLLHAHVLIYDLVLAGLFAWIKSLNFVLIPITVFACACGIFIICDLIGILRILLFRVTKLNNFFKFLGDKIDKKLYPNSLFAPLDNVNNQ